MQHDHVFTEDDLCELKEELQYQKDQLSLTAHKNLYYGFLDKGETIEAAMDKSDSIMEDRAADLKPLLKHLEVAIAEAEKQIETRNSVAVALELIRKGSADSTDQT